MVISNPVQLWPANSTMVGQIHCTFPMDNPMIPYKSLMVKYFDKFDKKDKVNQTFSY